MVEEEKKFLLSFGYNCYLKSYTLNVHGDIDEIVITKKQDDALHLSINDAAEYKCGLFNMFKPEIIEYGTLKLCLPSVEEYHMMHQRRLENSTGEELCDEVLARIDSTLTVAVLRRRLGFCFGKPIAIHYTDNEKEVDIEEVFKNLKRGGKSFMNGLTQYRWQCNEHIEVIELGYRSRSYWINKRFILPFKYNSPLEMLTNKEFKFPTNGYKEGFICEGVWFGNTHDCMEIIDGKCVIKPFKGSSFNLYEEK